MFHQDNILYLISLSNLMTCLLDNLWIQYGGSYMLITCGSNKGLKAEFLKLITNKDNFTVAIEVYLISGIPKGCIHIQM